jgi:nicotinamidase-related amidase
MEDIYMSEWKMVGKPALILIHMQHGITHPEGTLGFFGHAKTTRASGIIPRQQELVDAFRNKNLPVIHVVAVTDLNSKFPVYGRFWGSIQKTGANLPDSKDIEVIPELAPLPDEPVLGNWVFGMFSNNNLGQILKHQGIETLVLAGVATDMAVLAAVYQASDQLYNLIVPSDASTSGNPKFHEAAIEMIDAIALVTTTEDVIKHL